MDDAAGTATFGGYALGVRGWMRVVFAGRSDKCAKERALVAVIHQKLRMPLHPYQEGALAVLDPLDDMFFIMGGGDQIAGQPVDRLMVDGVDDHAGMADELGELRARHKLDA